MSSNTSDQSCEADFWLLLLNLAGVSRYMREMTSTVPVYRCKVSPTSPLYRRVAYSTSCPWPRANIPGTGTKVWDMGQNSGKACRCWER